MLTLSCDGISLWCYFFNRVFCNYRIFCQQSRFAGKLGLLAKYVVFASEPMLTLSCDGISLWCYFFNRVFCNYRIFCQQSRFAGKLGLLAKYVVFASEPMLTLSCDGISLWCYFFNRVFCNYRIFCQQSRFAGKLGLLAKYVVFASEPMLTLSCDGISLWCYFFNRVFCNYRIFCQQSRFAGKLGLLAKYVVFASEPMLTLSCDGISLWCYFFNRVFCNYRIFCQQSRFAGKLGLLAKYVVFASEPMLTLSCDGISLWCYFSTESSAIIAFSVSNLDLQANWGCWQNMWYLQVTLCLHSLVMAFRCGAIFSTMLIRYTVTCFRKPLFFTFAGSWQGTSTVRKKKRHGRMLTLSLCTIDHNNADTVQCQRHFVYRWGTSHYVMVSKIQWTVFALSTEHECGFACKHCSLPAIEVWRASARVWIVGLRASHRQLLLSCDDSTNRRVPFCSFIYCQGTLVLPSVSSFSVMSWLSGGSEHVYWDLGMPWDWSPVKVKWFLVEMVCEVVFVYCVCTTCYRCAGMLSQPVWSMEGCVLSSGPRRAHGSDFRTSPASKSSLPILSCLFFFHALHWMCRAAVACPPNKH